MWSGTHSLNVSGLKAECVWAVWTDVNRWHLWQDDIDYAKLEGEFRVGKQTRNG